MQRVSRASVRVEGREVARIDAGLLLLAAVVRGDGDAQAVTAAEKVSGLRIFADDAGKMNLDVRQSRGAVLLVSQFTLAASLERGRRPSFEGAAEPAVAREVLARLATELRDRGLHVGEGVFGADMAVELVNDGPVTFVLEVPPASG